MIPGDRDALLLRSPRAAVAFRIGRRSTALSAIAWLLAGSVAVLSLTLGRFDIGAAGVLLVLPRLSTLIEYDVVVQNRLPRALTGLGVGAAFALSGAILQRIAANPLVSPDVIGVNSGAAFGALTVLTVFGGTGLHTVAGALAG
ncbi:iron chelate uptake ABC transporter family permease subunit, partial [Streptomonospora algeriensis]